MLNQQVNLQREKIQDLEAILESRRNAAPPGMAQELADLQHKCLALERDKLEAERRLRHSNVWLTCTAENMSGVSISVRAGTPFRAASTTAAASTEWQWPSGEPS